MSWVISGNKVKIERAVGYVKANFTKNQVYDGIDYWNKKSHDWLERTGNYKVHGTTKRDQIQFSFWKKHT